MRTRPFLFLLAGALGVGVARGQVPAGRPVQPDTLATVIVWSPDWPAGRRDSVVHRLRMDGGGFLVSRFAYVVRPGGGVEARLAWIDAPLKKVRTLTFRVRPYDRNGRPVARWRGGGPAELVVAGPLAASPVPRASEVAFRPLRYGPRVACVLFSRVDVVYADGTARSFSGPKLRGLLADAVANTCPRGAPPDAGALPAPLVGLKRVP